MTINEQIRTMIELYEQLVDVGRDLAEWACCEPEYVARRQALIDVYVKRCSRWVEKAEEIVKRGYSVAADEIAAASVTQRLPNVVVNFCELARLQECLSEAKRKIGVS